MASPIIEAAKKEEEALTKELEDLPVFQKLQQVRRLIALYEAIEEREPAKSISHVRILPTTTSPRAGTKAAQVDEVVTKFLTERGTRASSGELLPVVQAAGIELSGQIPAKTLSAFLTNSTRFNNVKRHGYGLTEWGDGLGPRGAKADNPSRALQLDDDKPEPETLDDLLGPDAKKAKPDVFE
ncbi:hypothetical protein J2046_000310 [Rhizobium petrolearium]|uniref:hypothetical protein n=1 Tax=Neorhizobium petrolearium TaxID=515361 RepID=UPI001AE127C5|nr:hypothetical protein [Neorhizobium petrolearium]MBP1842066.1 hypothetical protein [Neorhizobium petrolearium]